MNSQSFLRFGKKRKSSLQEVALEGDFSNSKSLTYAERIERRRKVRLVVMMSAVITATSLSIGFVFLKKNGNEVNIVARAAENIANSSNESEAVFVNDAPVEGTREEDESASGDDINFSKSENYKAKAVSFGESANAFTTSDESLSLKISDVRSESMMSRSGEETKIVITWKTNKMAKSEVRYQNNKLGEKKVMEDGFGYNHAVVLSKLESGQRYTYIINAGDRWGNRVSSDQFSIFIGSKPVSVFQLISREFDSIFGWATKK